MTFGMKFTGGFLVASSETSVEVGASYSHTWGSDKGWSKSESISYDCTGIGTGFEKECVITATRSTYRAFMRITFEHKTLPTCSTQFTRDFTSDWGIENVVSTFV